MIIRGIADAFLFAAHLANRKSLLEPKDIHHIIIVAVVYYVLVYQSFVEEALANG